MIICDKDELYTFDELDFILKQLQSDSDCVDSQISLVKLLQKTLSSEKDKKAIFFMPEQTYNLFSMLQGNLSVTNFNLEDMKLLIDSVSKAEESKIKNHILTKLNVLFTFIIEGNKVYPVSTPADNFKSLE